MAVSYPSKTRKYGAEGGIGDIRRSLSGVIVMNFRIILFLTEPAEYSCVQPQRSLLDRDRALKYLKIWIIKIIFLPLHEITTNRITGEGSP